MKTIMVFTFVFLACSCAPSKRVAVESPATVLPEVPTEKPDEPIPGIQNPDDSTIQLDELEQLALSDALSLSDNDAKNTVYLSNANFVNAGDDVEAAKQGVNLGINSLSNRAFLVQGRELGPNGSLIALDLRDYFGSRSDEVYALIEDNSVLPIVSETVRNRNLQFVTGKRIPLMHAQVFLETAFTASNYYEIKQIGELEDDYWLDKGIDRQAQFDDRDDEIFLAGFQESQISPDTNRLIRRMRGDNGACWNTYDVDSANPLEQSNVFKFPFTPEVGSDRFFQHNAGEIICIQRNGLMEFSLFNGAGGRENAAPTTVVVNTRAAPLGLDASITIRDCTGCHVQFVLPGRDEVLSSGGLLGKVVRVDEDYLALEVGVGAEVKMQKAAIAAVLPKGTLAKI